MNNSMSGKKRKPSYILAAVLLVVLLYIGYVLGLMAEYGDLKLSGGKEDFLYYFMHPLPLVFSQTTKQWMLLGAIAAFVIWIYYAAGVNNRIAGREYGTAKFEDPKVIMDKLNERDDPVKILGKELQLSTNDQKTGLNNNLLAIGGSGAGKSFFFVTPNILHSQDNLVITDPKGELLKRTGKYLEKQGYTVKSLNLVDPMHSNRYNPLAYIRKQDDVIKLVDILIKATTPKDSTQTDPFWVNAEKLFFASLFLYVWLAPQMEGKRNIGSVIDLLGEAKTSENPKEKSALDVRMEELTKTELDLKNPDTGETYHYSGRKHPAYDTYQRMIAGAADTVRSIYISANTRMAFLQNSPEILDLLSGDEMELSSIGLDTNKKVALFCVIPDAETTHNAIAGMFYSQLITELYHNADRQEESNRLPAPVSIWFDEFANIALPKDMTSIISTMRGRGISANIIIQNLTQLKAKYKDDWETITGNCDTLLYLGGNEQSTHKYISELLGKWTVEKRSTSASTGKNGNISKSDDVLSRELLMPDEVRMLSNKKEIVLIRGEYPVICHKYGTKKDPGYRGAIKLGTYTAPKKTAKPRPDPLENIKIMLANQPAYDNTSKTIITSLAQLRKLDPLNQLYRPSFQMEYVFDKEIKTETQENAVSGGSSDNSIRERMKYFDFTDEQIQQAVMASADGLSETQILEWFLPENSTTKMELSRQLQIQERVRNNQLGKTR